MNGRGSLKMANNYYEDGCLKGFPMAYCSEHGSLGKKPEAAPTPTPEATKKITQPITYPGALSRCCNAPIVSHDERHRLNETPPRMIPFRMIQKPPRIITKRLNETVRGGKINRHY